MDMLEAQREKIWYNLTVSKIYLFLRTPKKKKLQKKINRLRYTVRYQIRKATKELRLRTIRRFQPDLMRLYIEGERFKTFNLQNSSEPVRHQRPGRIRSRGHLSDKYKI